MGPSFCHKSDRKGPIPVLALNFDMDAKIPPLQERSLHPPQCADDHFSGLGFVRSSMFHGTTVLVADSEDSKPSLCKLRDSLLNWTEGDPLVIPTFLTLPPFLKYRNSYRPIIQLLGDRWRDAENVGQSQDKRQKTKTRAIHRLLCASSYSG